MATVNVWLVDIEENQAFWINLHDHWKSYIHDSSEQQRLASIHHPAAFRLSFAGRRLLHRLMPSASFTRSPSNRPILASSPTDFSFNIAHDDRFTVLAHCSTCEFVGADIVAVKESWSDDERRDYDELKQSMFSKKEGEWIGLDVKRFYVVWSVREAFFKARGEGISEEWKEVEFREVKEDGMEFEFEVVGDSDWRIQVVLLDARTILAVATKPSFQKLSLSRLPLNQLLSNESLMS